MTTHDIKNRNFLAWLRAKGVEWDDALINPLAKVGGSDAAPNFGVVARRALPVGTVLARIAKDGALLSPQTCLARDAIRQAVVGGGLACVIAFYVERYHASQFATPTAFQPYFDWLPEVHGVGAVPHVSSCNCFYRSIRPKMCPCCGVPSDAPRYAAPISNSLWLTTSKQWLKTLKLRGK